MEFSEFAKLYTQPVGRNWSPTEMANIRAAYSQLYPSSSTGLNAANLQWGPQNQFAYDPGSGNYYYGKQRIEKDRSEFPDFGNGPVVDGGYNPVGGDSTKYFREVDWGRQLSGRAEDSLSPGMEYFMPELVTGGDKGQYAGGAGLDKYTLSGQDFSGTESLPAYLKDFFAPGMQIYGTTEAPKGFKLTAPAKEGGFASNTMQALAGGPDAPIPGWGPGVFFAGAAGAVAAGAGAAAGAGGAAEGAAAAGGLDAASAAGAMGGAGGPSFGGLSAAEAAGGLGSTGVTGGGMDYVGDFDVMDIFGGDPNAGFANTFEMPRAIPETTQTLQDWGMTEISPGRWQMPGEVAGSLYEQLLPKVGETAAKGLLSKLMSGEGSASDYASILGKLAATGLGIYGANQQATATQNLANKYAEYGAPYRARLAESYADPNSFLANSPDIQASVNQGTSALARALSRQSNPTGSGTALQELQNYSTQGLFGQLGNERNRLANFGGLSNFNAAAPGLAGQAIGAQGGALNALGSGISSITNPPTTLEQALNQINGMQGLKINSGTGF